MNINLQQNCQLRRTIFHVNDKNGIQQIMQKNHICSILTFPATAEIWLLP
jgi:hypothetical protein